MKLQEKLKTSDGSFDKKNILAFSGLLFVAIGIVAVPAASQVTLHGGSNLKLGGGDVVDGGNTVYDSSAGQVATSVVDYSAATASDVGLENVENIALSNAVWSDLGIAKTDISPSDVGTTASDVGLGNVENEAQVAESGDTMTGTLDLSFGGFEELALEIGNNRIQSGTTDSELIWEDFPDSGIEIDESDSEKDMILSSEDTVILEADADADQGSGGTNNADGYRCYINGDTGDFNCNGAKNWIHSLNQTHNAFYTAQESPQVRAVYEGKASVDGQTRIELPSHWSKTVSDTGPELRSTATVQGKLAYAAVIEKTDDYLVLDSSEPATVNYRITGIREGYEDKQVVRPKEE